VHKSGVVDLDVLPPDAPRPEGDAVITRRAGRVCAIQTADCLPVLFASRDSSAIGAAHAGWRGLVAGVLENTIRAMDVAPASISAWLGPAIGPAHFEVGDEVRAAFLAAAPCAAAAFARNARGRWQCDLYQLARQRLAAVGITDVHGGDLCTYADPARFHSYRRDGGTTARLATLIWLAPPS
jgi:YfiH family protein